MVGIEGLGIGTSGEKCYRMRIVWIDDRSSSETCLFCSYDPYNLEAFELANSVANHSIKKLHPYPQAQVPSFP
jgi:hypothetical protein